MSDTEPLHFTLGGYDLSNALRSLRFDPPVPSSSLKISSGEHQALIGQLKKLSADGRDLSEIQRAIDKIEAERKDRLHKALAGVADLEIMAGTRARRFVFAYYYDGEAKTTQGIEYPVKRDGDGDPVGYSVLIDDYAHPFDSRYKTMAILRESLNERKIPYTIAYHDN